MATHPVYNLVIFLKCKPDAGHSVHMKFIFSDVDSLSMAT